MSNTISKNHRPALREDPALKLVAFLYLPLALIFCAIARPAAGLQATVSPAQTPPSNARSTRLSGTVADKSGAVIANATVVLRSDSGGPLQTARTDRNGFFTLSGVAANAGKLVVSAPGFDTRELTLTAATAPLRIALTVSAVNTTVNVQGREDDLIGIADSGTQGTVGAAEIAARPILRSGEVLETIPGVIITQHAGGGKANQYFLRGFNLDHGTDFAIFLDNMPLNLPSHAHGEGYADMNTVIPEFIRRVNYEKGPYFADVGNYGSAGSAHLDFYKTLPQNFLQAEGGPEQYARLVFGVSHRFGAGHMLYGGEAYHDNGPWTHPDNYYKFNGLATYSLGDDAMGSSATARAYHGQWHSSDQLPATAVPLVGLYGTLNPTDGGHSQRYSLQAEAHRQSSTSTSSITAYAFYYDLDLFSDFTYFLTDLTRGDQFEQQDRRWVAGLDARHTFYSDLLGRKAQTTFGLQIRNDWVRNGLYQSQNRIRVAKRDDDSGTILPATTQADRFTDTLTGLYAESKIQWASHFRSVLALRGDVAHLDVTSLVTAANSGSASKALPSPKLNLIFGPWARTEFYAEGGFSFHSNDARGTTVTLEPVSADNPYPNTPGDRIPALIPTKGAEAGVRTSAIKDLRSTLSIWYLHSASELQQDGDTGGTTASRQPSNRYGFEWANYYNPGEHIAIDFDLADSRALFTEVDSDDAAPNSDGGRRVPEAVGWVTATGITLHDIDKFTASLRLRNFGPRDLTSDSLYRSKSTVLLNAEVGYQLAPKWRLSGEFLNLLNRKDHDIDYAYESRVTPTAASAFTNVFHPVEPFEARFFLRHTF